MPATGNRAFERRAVLNAAVDIASPEQIVSYLTESAQNRQGCSVVGISAPYATAMADDAALRDAFLQADLLVPDGKGFTWACRLLGVPCGERLAIPDLCERLLAAGGERGWKVFVYGATEEVNAKACANVTDRFPGLACVAGQHGYSQGPAEEDAVIARLKNESFNLLIVARPSPDKERFLARCCREAGVVGLAAGGYADILAGKTARAPALVQAAGLEWLYRVIQEPRRLWKRIGWANARFAAAALWAHLRMPAARPWWGCPAVHVAAVLLALCAAYNTSLNVPYHFDDPEYIQDNPTIRSFKALGEIRVLSFRKMWWLSNALCYRLSELFGNHQVDKPDVRIFRAWNIGCHLLAALALFGLLRRALRASGHVRSAGTPPDGGAGTPYDLAAAAAAAIFAAHPLCTEAVTYISGRDNGQGGMFYLLGLYAAAVAFDRMGLGKAAALTAPSGTLQPLRWPRWFWPSVWTVVFGACAVLTKENHLTFPAAVALVYAFFFRGAQAHTLSVGLLLGVAGAMAALTWGAAGRRDGQLGFAFLLMLLLTALGAVLGGKPAAGERGGWRTFFQQQVSLNWAFLAVVIGSGLSAIIAFPYAYQRAWGALTGYLDSDYVRSLCTQAYAVPWMLLRAIAPFGLSIDHDFPSISDPSDPRTLAGAAVLAALVAFGLFGMWRRWLGAFGVLLALVSIVPTNTIIERGDVVSERNFYLVAAGGACLLAWLVAVVTSLVAARAATSAVRQAAPEKESDIRRGMLSEAGLWTGVLGCCLAGPFASFTVLRNDEWTDAFRLWDSARQHAPEKLRVLYNYGISSAVKKKYEQADMAFSSVIRIGEVMAEKKLFRPDESVQVKCFDLAYYRLASLQLRRYMAGGDREGGAPLRAVDEIYRRGMERTAYDPDLAYTYAQFLLQLGRASDSAQVLQQALNMHGWADHLYYPLGLSYLEIGQLGLAREFLSRATGVQEHHSLGVAWDLPAARRAEIHAYLGLTRLLLKQRVDAKNDLRTSLALDPQGVLMMLTTTSRTRNPKLKPIEMDPPDMLIISLSVTRRDLLEVLLQSCDEALQAQPEKEQTIIRMLRGVVDKELQRRGAYRKKRVQFGFLDDLDAD